jgi:DTW domain-containing protein
VVLLVHHIELRKSSNTGLLATELLQGSQVVVRGRLDAAPAAPTPGPRLLLYPGEGATPLGPEHTKMAATAPLTLVVPDGTWAQARRASRRDPWALGAAPVGLPLLPPSAYRLRTAPRPDMVSTLEAIAHAVALLEGPPHGDVIRAQMLSALEVFVERSLRVRGMRSSVWMRI